MSADISKTSAFVARLANLKQSQLNSAKTSASGVNTPAPISPNEPVTIVVTSLNEKVQDLQKLLDGVDKNISTLTSSRDRADQAVGIIEELGGITVRARDTLKSDTSYADNKQRLDELTQRFNNALDRLSKLVDGSNINGVNLLKGETLSTAFGADGKNPLVTTGMDLSPEALGFRAPDFSTPEKIMDSRIDMMNAMDIAVTLRHVISSDLMLMQTRQEFSQETISTLASGATSVSSAITGDESANLLALHVRQQLSETDAPLASESQQFILKQF